MKNRTTEEKRREGDKRLAAISATGFGLSGGNASMTLQHVKDLRDGVKTSTLSKVKKSIVPTIVSGALGAAGMVGAKRLSEKSRDNKKRAKARERYASKH